MIEAIGKALWPVEGKFWGQSHWKPVFLQKGRYTRQVYLKKSDDGAWTGRGLSAKLKEAGISLQFDLKIKKVCLFESIQKIEDLDEHRIKVTLKWNSSINGLQTAKAVLQEMGIEVKRKKGQPKKVVKISAILDDSTLDMINKTGTAKVYRFDNENTPITLRGKAYAVTPFIPVYLCCVIAYNLLRIVPVIIYLAARIIYDSARSDEALGSIAKERAEQMGIQTGESLWNVIRAPYYALGMQLGAICMLFDPFNGRKVVSSFERKWNHDLPLSKSIWICRPLQDYHFEGGGDPAKLGEHAFRLPGCFGETVEVGYDDQGVLRVTQCFAERTFLGTVGHKVKFYSEEQIESVKCCTCFPLCCQCI